MSDLTLFEDTTRRQPSLADYDVILVASSAGKDSQAMLDYVAELAQAAGVMDRVVVLHNDLGEVEWPGTSELAQEQAGHYGFRFEMRHREQGYTAGVAGKRGPGLDRPQIAAVDVPLPVLTLQVAAAHTTSPSDQLAYCLDEWLVSHPDAPVSTDATYPTWAAALAAQPTYHRPQEAS